MRAIRLERFGPPERLQLVDVPPPACGPGTVRVSVRAVGVNFADVFSRLGLYPGIPEPPFIPGIEFSGDVVELSGPSHGLKRGDRVAGFTRQGAYAEEVCVPGGFLTRMPRRMPYEAGASMIVTYLSAWHGMKTLGQAKKGETVLVHSAAGGVGSACLQLGTHWGCRMIGTASSEEKRDLVRSWGAIEALDYDDKKFEEQVREATGGVGVDIVMDAVGGRVMRRSWTLLAPMGRYVVYGFAAASGRRTINPVRLAAEYLRFPIVHPSSLPSRNVSLMGFNLYFLAERRAYFQGVLRQIFALYEKKIVAPVIHRAYELAEAAEAHRYMQSRKSVGKIILKMGRDAD